MPLTLNKLDQELADIGFPAAIELLGKKFCYISNPDQSFVGEMILVGFIGEITFDDSLHIQMRPVAPCEHEYMLVHFSFYDQGDQEIDDSLPEKACHAFFTTEENNRLQSVKGKITILD